MTSFPCAAPAAAFVKYNEIRNDKSYAHDNDVLDKAEATYVVSIVTATLSLINAIE
ncbi:MAG: abortive infection family protein [Oscillospiraceae bacterium]|nr:abortive infection family protein [Oscillospiraceae bacterium]